MSNFWLRGRTAIIFGIVIIGATVWNIYSYSILVVAIILFSINEYFNLLKYTRETNRVTKAYKPLGIIIGAGLFIASILIKNKILPVETYLLFMVAIFLFFIYFPRIFKIEQ